MQVRTFDKIFDKKKSAAVGSLRVCVLFLAAAIMLCAGGCAQKAEDELRAYSVEDKQTEAEDSSAVKVEDSSAVKTEEKEESAPEKEPDGTCVVYVCGAVSNPGVYELPCGARIYEAIAMAGGVRDDAAEDSITQAQTAKDGERIYIPTEEEVAQGMSDTGGLWQENPQTAGTFAKVNINTATAEELTSLSGIGESRAQSILRYRESNGAFQSIEDLMKVEGIKSGIFEKIKDYIEV